MRSVIHSTFSDNLPSSSRLEAWATQCSSEPGDRQSRMISVAPTGDIDLDFFRSSNDHQVVCPTRTDQLKCTSDSVAVSLESMFRSFSREEKQAVRMAKKMMLPILCSGRSVKMSRDIDGKVSCMVYSKSSVKALRRAYTKRTMSNPQFLVLDHLE